MIGEGNRVSQTYQMRVDSTAQTVFPLLCPLREYDWIEGWKCKMVFSQSGIAESGCVFLTELPGRGVETWMVSRYEPNHGIDFCRVAGASRACHLTIDLEDNEDGSTTLLWTYTHTAIDDAGRDFVDAHSAARYQAEMESMKGKLTHYLREGEMWRASEHQ